MLDINKNQTPDIGDGSTIIRMYLDYTTSSGGVGKRTYKSGQKYLVDNYLLSEMTEVPELLGEKSYGHHSEAMRPEYENVSIVPKVTKSITSSGVDTFKLQAGQEITVPGNLAAYLQCTGQV